LSIVLTVNCLVHYKGYEEEKQVPRAAAAGPSKSRELDRVEDYHVAKVGIVNFVTSHSC
jgi:hypothetical protein